ncbi:hypothetical protein Barb7_01736 [Bacteroidales bacterium Barb7]|nr:hypothetical protein Barb7_01736 [Bacteroidales bacterium Barb7]
MFAINIIEKSTIRTNHYIAAGHRKSIVMLWGITILYKQDEVTLR